MSTDPTASTSGGEDFDLDAPWRLHPRVALRPEPFGALLYHFETRRLTFLKTPALAGVVRLLEHHPTARGALEAAAVPAQLHASYGAALGGLAASSMICHRSEKGSAR